MATGKITVCDQLEQEGQNFRLREGGRVCADESRGADHDPAKILRIYNLEKIENKWVYSICLEKNKRSGCGSAAVRIR